VAFSRSPSALVRVAIFSGVFLISIVFWILDFRNSQLLNSCQTAAQALDGGRGGFHALNAVRQRSGWTWRTYGFAIDLLVAGVCGASLRGGYIYYSRLSPEALRDVAPLTVVAAVLLPLGVLQLMRWIQWRKEKTLARGG
jgi:hypothetical protein